MGAGAGAGRRRRPRAGSRSRSADAEHARPQRVTGSASPTSSASNSSASSSASTTSRRSSRALGHPERAFRSVHVAGTNGKGSVTAMVDAALRARRPPLGALHLAASRRSHRALRHRRPAGRRGDDARPRSATCARRSSSLRADGALAGAADVLRSDHRGRVRAVPPRRRRDRGARSRPRRPARRDQRRRAADRCRAITSIAFDHQQYLGDDAARDRAREGRHHQAGRAGRRRTRRAGARRHRASIERTVARDARRARLHPRRRDNGPTADAVDDYGRSRWRCAGASGANAAVAVRLLETLDALRHRRAADADRRRARAAVSGRAGSSVGARRTAASCCSTPRTTRPAPRARVLSSRALGGRRRPLVFAAMRDKDVARHVRARCCRPSSALIVTRASNARSADPDALAAAGARDRAGAADRRVVAAPVDGARRRLARIRRASSSPDRFSCSATS